MVRSRFVGGLLLIVGTSIGAGMLALPVANAAGGFWYSSLFLVMCWLLMTLGAFFILEVNLYLAPGHHLTSMAFKTLGAPGLLITWLTYLLLMYTLLSAYISGGADVLGGLLASKQIVWSDTMLTLCFTAVFGSIVYLGLRYVDWVNRGLMFLKLLVFLPLLYLLSSHVDWGRFQVGYGQGMSAGAVMISMTSFGFAIIVPNLRDYFEDNLPQLKKVILLGSLVPLGCYLAWDWVILGSLPSKGNEGLIALMQSEHVTRSLALRIADLVHHHEVLVLFNVFTSACMLTAFLGVALCLMSFLSDGLKISQKGRHSLVLMLLTFGPPVLLVLFYPGAYLYAMHYAGDLCVLLLLFLPAWMSYRGRARCANSFVVPGGRGSQWFLMLASVLLLVLCG